MKKSIYIFLIGIASCSYGQTTRATGEADFDEDQEQSTTFTKYVLRPPLTKTNVDISSFLPKPGNQGTKYSCWAFASTYSYRSFLDNVDKSENYFDIDTLKRIYSPEYTYQVIKGDRNDCEYSSLAWKALETILKEGVVPISDFPYKDLECNIQISQDVVNIAKQKTLKDYDVEVVRDLYSIKKMLVTNQPVIISIKIDDNFQSGKELVWNKFGEPQGSHAMVCVGFDDSKNAIKVLNSWGKRWGDNGYGWISYDIVRPALNYACYAKRISNLEAVPNVVREKVVVNNTDSIVTTLKKGYFIKFNEVNIVCSTLNKDKNGAYFEIKNSSNQTINEFEIDEKTVKEFFISGVHYNLTFKGIISESGAKSAKFKIEKLKN